MDQNADGTSDQNPLTTPFTGLTPGDVYAVPMPQPTVAGHASARTSYPPSAPFNQNTLPLIVPGPHVVEYLGAGRHRFDNLVLNGTTSTFNVTFDRPMQVGTFTPGQVLQIMGPAGSITGPQYFASDASARRSPPTAATPLARDLDAHRPELTTARSRSPSSRSSSTSRSPNDSGLGADPDRPGRDPDPAVLEWHLWHGPNFVNTVFDDAALTPITRGHRACSPGRSRPAGLLVQLSRASRSTGHWKLQLVNTLTGASGTLGSWSLNITPAITVTPVNPSGGPRPRSPIGFPSSSSAAPTRSSSAPASSTSSARRLDTTRTRDSTCSAARARTPRRPPSSTPRPTCPRSIPARPVDQSGHGELHDHRPRRLPGPGRQTTRGSAACGSRSTSAIPTTPT